MQVVTLNELVHQKAGLLYEDLYGVPCVLILCEKGRMGDTFPHTFDCLDMRLRSVHCCDRFGLCCSVAGDDAAVCDIVLYAGFYSWWCSTHAQH